MRTQRPFKNKSYANRGMQLERIIDMTNNQYRNSNKADIRKIPTPFKTMSTSGNKVVGHFEKPTWVDYSGIYNGKAIIFDAKQTSETAFPLSKLSKHQYVLLKSWHEKGAEAFLIVHFSKYDKYYLLPFVVLKMTWERAIEGGRKSIAHNEFEKLAFEIKSKDGYILHYLEVVE